MPDLVFRPSPCHAWGSHASEQRIVRATGWATAGDGSRGGDELARLVAHALDVAPTFAEAIRTLDGNFAVIAETQGRTEIAVDSVRSIPIVYRSNGTQLIVSDDLRLLDGTSTVLDAESVAEYATAGYVTGSHTLFEGIVALQSGECLTWDAGAAEPASERHIEYRCTYDNPASVDELCEQADAAFSKAFLRVIESVRGRQIVLPLSGGLDSRLVAWMLHRHGYDNVLCYTYGLPGNREAQRASAVADALRFKWIPVPYSGDLWKRELSSSAMREYWGFSANGISIPHCDDWPAVHALVDQGLIKPDAIFMPGHTGDFISGGHLKYLFDPAYQQKPVRFNQAIVDKHYSLWKALLRRPSVSDAINGRINEVVAEMPATTDEELARRYEYWEWQERQAKLIINSVRVYEYFGHSWRIPLWDRDVMEYWMRVPLSLKMDKYLFRRYLASQGPAAQFGSDAPARLWTRADSVKARTSNLKRRIKRRLEQFGPMSSAITRYEQYRHHLKTYRTAPTGMARAFGAFRYVAREPGKRNESSLLVADVLRDQFGVELSDVGRRPR